MKGRIGVERRGGQINLLAEKTKKRSLIRVKYQTNFLKNEKVFQ